MSETSSRTRTLDELGAERARTGSGSLHVLLQSDRPLEPSMHLCLAGIDRIILGRGTERGVLPGGAGKARNLVVRVADAWMSSSHAELVREGPQSFRIEDRGSRNGTKVNAERITTPLRLVDGDLVEVGRTFLLYRASGQTPASGRAGPTPEATTAVAAFARDLEDAARVAATKVPIVLLGETGTGKDVCARTLHALSGRRGDFVAVNCGAIPLTLFEAELFGHRRGSFSGAVEDRVGLVRSSDGGSLFLDEVAELPGPCQTALLRVLEEQEVLAVGATRPVSVDLRIIAATQSDLGELVKAARFREDLHARLMGFTLRLPPLRERREDLGALIRSLLLRTAGPSAEALTFRPDAARALLLYDWPRNVRELERCLATALALANAGCVELPHLPEALRAPPRARAAVVAASSPKQEPSEEDQLLRARLLGELREHRGNVSAVARAMGTRRMQIHRWAKRLEIDLESFRR